MGYFLPLAIDSMHFQKAFGMMGECFSHLSQYLSAKEVDCVKRSLDSLGLCDGMFVPHASSLIIRKLSNALFVNMLQTLSSQPSPPQRYLQDLFHNTLCTHFYLYHLLLSLSVQYPSLVRESELLIERFIQDTEARTKAYTPDLGEFLMLLMLSQRFTWDDIEEAYIMEMMTRNVFWTLHPRSALLSTAKVIVEEQQLDARIDAKGGKNERTGGKSMGYLAYLEQQPVNRVRLEHSFVGARTSLLITLLQKFLISHLRTILTDGKLTANFVRKMSPGDLLCTVSKRRGGLSPQAFSLVQSAICDFLSIQTWYDFYYLLHRGIPSSSEAWLMTEQKAIPTPKQVCSMLKMAVFMSEMRGYHMCRLSTSELRVWRAQVDPEIREELEYEGVRNNDKVRMSVEMMKRTPFFPIKK
jgi:hypothetical protein